jgi:hypothetical protein
MRPPFPFALAIALVAGAPSALAQLTARDTGTFVVLDRDFKPTELQYRLSRKDAKWVMEGKKPGAPWERITCPRGCDYRDSTRQEVAAYFPPDWSERMSFACIQNVGQAFCRGVEKADPSKSVFFAVALASEKPFPLFLRRTGPP